MPQMTLLEMVTDILNDMDSDPVNSISDTIEAEQVAQTIKTTYYELIEGKEWGRQRKLLTLTETSVSTPTVFTIPATVTNLVDPIKYKDENENWNNIYRRDWDEFLDILLGYKSTDSDVTVQTLPNSDLTVYVRNNIQPSWWTSYDDNSIIMDSYKSTVDTYLKASKLIVYGEVTASWSAQDTFVPIFPDNMFSYLLAESKKRCFQNLKQMASPTVNEQARRGQIRSQTTKAWKQNGYPERPNFGR